MAAARSSVGEPVEHVRVAIVGAGFGGIATSVALQREGVDHVLLERGDAFGGTWRDNTYPGCRCDVPSHLYSLSFAPNPDWSETYSRQSEIQAYLLRVADEYGVPARTRLGCEVGEAAWREDEQRWHLRTTFGDLTADLLVLGNGLLAEPALPDIPGLDRFEGEVFHSARWRHDLDLRGRRVAVIGTGASAVQFVPEIQPVVDHLTVFQRTPAWVMPHRNRRVTRGERALYRVFPLLQRFVRARIYWTAELLVGRAMVGNRPFLGRIQRLAERHLERQVPDPEMRAKLTPQFTFGCKRLLLSDDWYPALQQPNVSLVTEKIVEVRPHALVTADGAEHPADTIVFGTGFHVTDNPIAHRVRGRGGHTLSDAWRDTGPRAYLGCTVSGFPNLFMLAGPNSNIGHTSLVFMIEAQIAHTIGAVRTLERTRAAGVELRPTVQQAWTAEMERKSAGTVWGAGNCASWYLDAQGRNTAVWPDQTYRFRLRARRFDPSHYEITARRDDH